MASGPKSLDHDLAALRIAGRGEQVDRAEGPADAGLAASDGHDEGDRRRSATRTVRVDRCEHRAEHRWRATYPRIDGAAPARRHDPRRARLLPVQGRATAASSTSARRKSLRQRLSNYFQNPRSLPPRTAQMVATAETVEWIQVRNDVEALMLEYTLIKQHRPRFNVRLRDDKSYPFLAVTVDDEWPRPMVMRGRKRKGVRYFGPYGHAYAIRETLDLLLRTFPLRTCSRQQVRASTSGSAGRACCSTSRSARARASARSTTEAYDELRRGAARVPRRRHRRGRAAARDARCTRRPASSSSSGRPGCATGWPACSKAIEKQQMVAERNEDLDVIGIADDELEAAVQVFYVRKGRVVGRKGFIVDKVEDLTPGELVGQRRSRGSTTTSRPMGMPKQVLVPVEPDDPELYEEWLSRAARARRSRSGCRSGATSASCRRRSPATPRRSSSATGCGGRPTTTAGPGRSTSCRSTSACPRRRCASSATT